MGTKPNSEQGQLVRDMLELALAVARESHPFGRAYPAAYIAKSAGMSKALYSMRLSGQRGLTAGILQDLIDAFPDNPTGRAALRLVKYRAFGSSEKIPVRLLAEKRNAPPPLTEDEAFAIGLQVRDLYDEGDHEKAIRIGSRALLLRPESFKYTREWITTDSILVRALSDAGRSQESANLAKRMLAHSEREGDTRIDIYSHHSMIASRQRQQGRAQSLSVLDSYRDVLEGLILRNFPQADVNTRWLRTMNQNLRSQLIAVFTALEAGREEELLRKMRSTWERVRQNAENFAYAPEYMLANDQCEARVLAYDNPEAALELLPRLSVRSKKLSFHLAIEVTRLVALQTQCLPGKIRRQANIVGAFGVLTSGSSRSERLMDMRRRAIRGIGSPPDKFNLYDSLEQPLSAFPELVDNQRSGRL